MTKLEKAVMEYGMTLAEALASCPDQFGMPPRKEECGGNCEECWLEPVAEDGCEGCRWKKEARWKKCNCCRRNKLLKDNFVR